MGALLQLPLVHLVACVQAVPEFVVSITTTPPAKTIASLFGSTPKIKSYHPCPLEKSDFVVFPSHQFGFAKVVHVPPLLSERKILAIPLPAPAGVILS